MDQNQKIFGYVEGQNSIAFVLSNFECIFINTGAQEGNQTIYRKNGFIIGRILSNSPFKRYLYIPANADYSIQGVLGIRVWSYIVSSKPALESYNYISFSGGILDKLYFRKSIQFNRNGYQYCDDSSEYELIGDLPKGKLKLSSHVIESFSVGEGTNIKTGNTKLELIFESEQGLSAYTEIYDYILTMCRFMSFRKNVSFTEVKLGVKSDNQCVGFEYVADCYIKQDKPMTTSKNYYDSITFDDLGGQVVNLLKAISDKPSKNSNFLIGFIPENDADAPYVTENNIREIFSALELEIELADINLETEEAFSDLLTTLKDTIKEHRNSDSPLENNKTYDRLFGALEHADGALSDKILKCSEECMPIFGAPLGKEQVDEIVKCRNAITHGSYVPMNQDVADTAYLLKRLIYCLILKRIGMDEESLTKLFRKRIVS